MEMETLSVGDKISFIVFLLGAGLDTGLTLFLIKRPSFREGNPVVAEALNHAGLAGMLGIKVAVASVGLVIMYKFFSPDDMRKAVRTGLLVCGGVWLIAGIWNASLFFFF